MNNDARTTGGMAGGSQAHAEGQPKAVHIVRSGVSDDRLPADTGATGAAEGVLAASEEETPLGPAPELATVDQETRAAVNIIQPERGIGSGIPYDTYRAIVMLLREGVPMVTIGDRFGYSRTTISEIKARHTDLIPSHRDLMTQKAENLRELLSDAMVDAVQSGRMSPNQYAFTYGIVSDKYMTETGQNQQKHEHIHVSLDKNDLGSLLSGLGGSKPDEKSVSGTHSSPQKQEDPENSAKS